MERVELIRTPKIENVSCTKNGSTETGTLHLTAHHIIFGCNDPKRDEKEIWVAYPSISLVTRSAQSLTGQCPLTIHTRTFETYSFLFWTESDALCVFESVKELTVVTAVDHLYAFSYAPNPSSSVSEGWSLYSPRDEFLRMGVGSRSKAWRFTDLNKDYSLCSTYPARLVVPTRISDTTLQYAAKYRSKGRIPALAYLHWANFGSITRCSQPLVGFSQNRSIQDEKLVEAIFQSHWAPESRATASQVFGATATNLIMDARPTRNAVANTAKGAGTENMDHYKEGRKAYLGIDNIHAMRDSLAKVVDALREADNLAASMGRDVPGLTGGLPTIDRHALRRSDWLRHMSNIMEGTVLLIRNVHVNSSHVLIHCSDGWDRTSQLSSLSQLCLDPYYRTVRGFQILIEKDWLSFGHRFLDRCGHLSSDKFFISQPDKDGTDINAAQNFITSMQNRIISPHHLKETSPVFHQFLETVRQIQRQYPDRFEFNERFLRRLHCHLYSCQYGTFLYNSEMERRVGDAGSKPPCERTVAVWDFFNSPQEASLNLNPTYDNSLDDPKGRDMGVLFPNPKDVRFWHELYGRSDEEMNGRPVNPQIKEDAELVGPINNSEEDFVLNPSAASSNVATLPAKSTGSFSSAPLEMKTDNGNSNAQGPMRLWNSTPSQSEVSGSPSRSTDFFGGQGVKSVWGRFSSNATAAFSAVSEAYEGVTKDFKGLSITSPGPQGSELQRSGTDAELGGWGDIPSSPRRALTLASNQAISDDSLLDTRRSSFSTYDNPWTTAKAASPKTSSPPAASDLSAPLFSSDPDLTLRRANSQMKLPQWEIPSSEPSPRRIGAKLPAVPPPEPEPITDRTDPLGVAVL